MKTVSVREAQHNLARILREVQRGGTVEIQRRKVPVARIVPVASDSNAEMTVDWSDQAERMAAIWGETRVEGIDRLLNGLRSDE